MGAKGRGGPICFGRPELTVSVRLAHASLTLIGSRQFGRPSSHASAPPAGWLAGWLADWPAGRLARTNFLLHLSPGSGWQVRWFRRNNAAASALSRQLATANFVPTFNFAQRSWREFARNAKMTWLNYYAGGAAATRTERVS